MGGGIMQWYAVIDKKTGEAVSFGTEIASEDILKEKGLISIPIDHQPGEGEKWDPKERAVVPAPKPTIISHKST